MRQPVGAAATIVSLLLAADTAVALNVYVPPAVLSDAVMLHEGLADVGHAGLIAKAVTEATGFDILTDADIEAVLELEKKKDLLGCDTLDCVSNIGQLAKVDLLVRSELGLLGGKLLLSGVVIQVTEQRVVTRQTIVFGLDPATLPQALTALGKRLFGAEAAVPGETQSIELTGRVLVAADASTDLVDEAGLASLERSVAERVVAEVGLTVAAREEVKGLLQDAAQRQALGAGDPDVMAQIGEAARARYVVALSVGNIGSRVVVSASLLDTDRTAIAARGSVLLQDTSQIADGAQVVTLGLFGRDAVLPPPLHEPNRTESALEFLAASLARGFRPYQTGVLSRLAVLPLTHRGAEAKARDLGTQIPAMLRQSLTDKHSLPIIAQTRFDELAAAQDLSQVATMTAKQLQEVGRFLGASVLTTGTVTDMGRDFLVRVALVPVETGVVAAEFHSFIPMGEPTELIKKAFVVRTTAGAIFRSFVPGWGQFYNGPEHTWKGVTILSGTLAGAGAAVAGFVLASMKDQEKLLWDTGKSEYLSAGCTPSDASHCLGQIERLNGEAQQFQIMGFVAVGVAAAFYLWGFIDAAVFAEDYSELSATEP